MRLILFLLFLTTTIQNILGYELPHPTIYPENLETDGKPEIGGSLNLICELYYLPGEIPLPPNFDTPMADMLETMYLPVPIFKWRIPHKVSEWDNKTIETTPGKFAGTFRGQYRATSKLTVTNLDESNFGDYECMVEFTESAALKSNLTITVQAGDARVMEELITKGTPPQMKKEEPVPMIFPYSTTTLSVGDQLNVTCTAEYNTGKPRLFWKIPVGNFGNPRITAKNKVLDNGVSKNATSFLAIQNVQTSDSGVYICRLDMESKTKVAKFRLYVV